MTKDDIELTKEAIDFYNLNHFKGDKTKKQLIKVKSKLDKLNKVKNNIALGDVSNQRELLLAYDNYLFNDGEDYEVIPPRLKVYLDKSKL